MERRITDKKELVKLIGFLTLSDGGIYTRKNRHGNLNNGQFIMNHTSLDYINYAKSILENITSVIIRERKDYNNDGCNRKQQWRLETKSLPFLTKLKDLIYKGTYKGIPSHLLKLMDEECLAMMYMADGGFSVTKTGSISSVNLHTKRLTEGDNLLLSKYLKIRFNIDSTINKQNKYYYIRIKGTSIYHFFKLIKPYILNDFLNKVPNDKLLLRYKQDDDIV